VLHCSASSWVELLLLLFGMRRQVSGITGNGTLNTTAVQFNQDPLRLVVAMGSRLQTVVSRQQQLLELNQRVLLQTLTSTN